MPTPFVMLSTEPTNVVTAEEVIEHRVLLEVPLSDAAEALGLTTDEYAGIERGALFFKDGDQWAKAKSLIRAASHFAG